MADRVVYHVVGTRRGTPPIQPNLELPRLIGVRSSRGRGATRMSPSRLGIGRPAGWWARLDNPLLSLGHKGGRGLWIQTTVAYPIPVPLARSNLRH